MNILLIITSVLKQFYQLHFYVICLEQIHVLLIPAEMEEPAAAHLMEDSGAPVQLDTPVTVVLLEVGFFLFHNIFVNSLKLLEQLLVEQLC